MTIILDQYPVPETGTFEIHQVVTVHISAEEARRKVARWLRRDVSHMMGTEAPVLVVGTPTHWSVPAHFSMPHIGVIGQVGEVHVDALSGELLDLLSSRRQIEERAKALAALAPPFQAHTTVPSAYKPIDIPAAPKLYVTDDDLISHEAITA